MLCTAVFEFSGEHSLKTVVDSVSDLPGTVSMIALNYEQLLPPFTFYTMFTEKSQNARHAINLLQRIPMSLSWLLLTCICVSDNFYTIVHIQILMYLFVLFEYDALVSLFLPLTVCFGTKGKLPCQNDCKWCHHWPQFINMRISCLNNFAFSNHSHQKALK